MRITILNGSPKGDMSVTLQYAKYLQKVFPQHTYTVFNVAQRIKSIEKDGEEFEKIIGSVRESDGVLWAFPLYFMLVHGNYKRFIELVFERGAASAFAGKYAASISTSIKFYDNTANDYIHAISEDLDMQFTGFYSAAMNDLHKPSMQRTIRTFAERFFYAIETKEQIAKKYDKQPDHTYSYTAVKGARSLDAGSKKIVIVADEVAEGSNLAGMIETFRSQFRQDIPLVDLSKVDIKGGCLGCIHCGYDNTCVWKGKDGYIDMYNGLKSADIIIFAGAIHDRYLSSKWKTFFDRSFFNTHQPSLDGKQWGFLISGPFRHNATLQTILQAWTEFQQSGFAGVVTDEQSDPAQTGTMIESFAKQALWAADHRYINTETFLRVGGIKIFRDEVFANMRVVFRADHLYYKKHGIYDFPQKKTGMRVLNFLLMLLLKIPPVRKRVFTRELVPGMVSGFKNILESARP